MNNRTVIRRLLIAFAAVALLLIFLTVGLGYGTYWLSKRDQPTSEEIENLRQFEHEPERVVGFHEVREWPESTGRFFQEAPLLRAQVEEKKLPPVEERLPENPLVIVPPEQIGPYGGNWNQFSIGPADLGVMASLSYETLIRWDPLLQDFRPNLASDWEVDREARNFTFFLREGVRWSDGEPFTADDILFWYEQVLLNRELTPILSNIFVRGGEIMEVEKIDRFTIRFSFQEPHGLFLQWIANPLLEEAVKFPRHYFRRFHPDFIDPQHLENEARRLGFSAWYQLFHDKAEWWNREKPALQAWILERPPPARQITFVRNPYYWKIDSEGNQLPYIDRLTFEIVSAETMTLRFLQGDAGMQFRHVDPLRYPLFMENRKNGNYRVLEWISSSGSGVLMPNLNHRDPFLKNLMNDRRFRIALSHAIDRKEINETRYLGMGKPMQLGPTFTTPFFRDEYVDTYVSFDPEKANRLLDEIGLEKRDRRGIRLRPDGKPLELTIETFDEAIDRGTLQLVADGWRSVGIETHVTEYARPLYYERMPARLHDIAVGTNSSLHTPLLDHMYFVPYGLGARHALEYAAWFMSDGERGEEPPDEMKRAMEIYFKIERT
ncbi:MAG TPA: ABC transporter substrate-binding protein, partial [Opitutales bacterium]|nr:ABC transporter substrate-binding protein [Opitutales bacterium]